MSPVIRKEDILTTERDKEVTVYDKYDKIGSFLEDINDTSISSVKSERVSENLGEISRLSYKDRINTTTTQL
jgi:hypothetical protein